MLTSLPCFLSAVIRCFIYYANDRGGVFVHPMRRPTVVSCRTKLLLTDLEMCGLQ